MVRALSDPESWVAQRISPPATPSTPAGWSVKSQPWLSHHVIYGTVVVPGATYATMALAAAGAPAQVRDVFFYEPIILPDKASREVQLTLHPLEDGGGWTFQVHSRPYGERDAEWSLNADGRIVTGVDDEPAPESAESIDAACERLSRTRPQQLFDTFADMELTWGPTWSTSLKSLWAGDGEAVGDVAIGDELAEQLGSEPIHPVLLDLCTGVAFPAFPAVLAATEDGGPWPICSCRCGMGGWCCVSGCQNGSIAARGGKPAVPTAKRRSSTSISWIGTVASWAEFASSRSSARPGRRCCAGSVAMPPGTCTPSVGRRCRRRRQSNAAEERRRHLADRRIRRAVGRAARFHRVGPSSRIRSPGSGCSHRLHERGAPVSGIVWRSTGQPGADESTAEFAARLETEIDQLLTVVRTLQAQQDVKLTGGLWIITERAVATESGEPVDPVQAALWGFGRTVITEQPALRCRLVDYDGFDDAVHSLAGPARHTRRRTRTRAATRKVLGAAAAAVGAQRPSRGAPREPITSWTPTERGAIDNLRLVETDVPPPSAGQVQIRVEAAGLNFRDVLNVLGLYPGDPGRIGGGDLSGIVTEVGAGVTGFEVGQRVFGFMPGAFATRVNVPAQFLAPVPNGMSAVGAATIPAGALTTRLAFDWAKVGPGDRVLIHAASGGVGLAAIQLAQQRGATVFATASTYKRATLRKMGVEYVYDSRTPDFADQILADTGGAGVDVVLNSLTNEGFIEATVRATAQGGRFAEIAKRDIWTPEQMAAARPDIDYEIVALDATIEQEPERIGELAGRGGG